MIEFKKYEESLPASTGPDMTPLIDMVFLLLIFFLLTSFLALPSIPVDLPEAETAQLNEKPEVSITIRKDGILLLNGKIITEGKLKSSLKRIYAFQRSKEVIIQSDKEVQFGRIVAIMDISKKAGARNISFLVEQKQ